MTTNTESAVIRGRTRTVIANIPLCQAASGITVDPRTNAIYTANPGVGTVT